MPIVNAFGHLQSGVLFSSVMNCSGGSDLGAFENLIRGPFLEHEIVVEGLEQLWQDII